MNPKKAVCGVAVSAALVACFGVAGVSLAEGYAPTVLGNDAYTNQTDAYNDYGVAGIYATTPISEQNSDTVAEARALSIQMGSATEGGSPIIVTNSTGKSITGFAYRDNDATDYPSSILSGTLADGQSACWNFTYAYGEKSYTNEAGKTYSQPWNYTIEVAFDDGTTGEFHNLNLNGVRTINLCWSDDYGVYFAERTTITNHTPDPNLYYEANLAAEADGEAFDFHVNSAAAMGELMHTASRSDGPVFDTGAHDPTQTIEDFGIEIPLYGYCSADFNDDVYALFQWNSDGLTWRIPNDE